MSVMFQNVTDEKLAGYFKEYIERFQCKERHTQAACDETLEYERLLSRLLPNDYKPHVELYGKMMDVAVEYEESGFMAGYRACMEHLQGAWTEAQEASVKAGNVKVSDENEPLEVLPRLTVEPDSISSMQIAEITGVPNRKIYYRIKNKILPYCTEQVKSGFKAFEVRNPRGRNSKIYRLDYTACTEYVRHMSAFRNTFDTGERIDKIVELVKSVFPGKEVIAYES